MKTVLAWHFADNRLRDGRPLPPDGEWLVHDGPCVMCKSGLHASRRIIDALQYAPGHTICRVRCADIASEVDDKLLCRRRKILWRVDGEQLLRTFARECALSVIHLWDAPDVVRQYLETGDESLRDAAQAAAQVAVWDAAQAARATRAAAWDAARATRAAARAATQAAAWDNSNKPLTKMVMDAHRNGQVVER